MRNFRLSESSRAEGLPVVRIVEQLTSPAHEERPCGSVVEHSLGKGEVMRSIRIMGTIHFFLSLIIFPVLFNISLGLEFTCSGAKDGQG